MYLFICTTILHIRIVNKLLEKIDDPIHAVVLFIGDTESPKVVHYLNTLIEPKCRCILYNDQQINVRKPFKTIRRSRLTKNIIQLLPSATFQQVYLACVELPLAHHILSSIQFRQLVTFDDGLYNLCSSKRLEKVKNINLSKRLARSISGRKYHTDRVLKESVKHYTIFNNLQNIIDNTEYIELAPTPSKKGNEQGAIGILLGTVYSEICASDTAQQELVEQLNRLIRERRIGLYIPHPRDTTTELRDIKVITTNLSAEDEIMTLIEDGYSIELYGFSSTVQCILSSSNAVKSYSLQFSGMTEEYRQVELELSQYLFGFTSIDLSK
ncbi:TPA: hypothetical protein KEY68_002166 [Providencia rettgeri]|uniref:glycosyltransferase family 52 n=1 Tax=Providencia TaxID=586 RepID=UPI001B985E32|nr:MULTISPECIES: glycosyltransferase family 52 [Providencia]MDK7745643.1 glycosyltransferase family 52 [Providencia rettgeri]MDK7758047.1 glycosyltransferase family 52 [Providencia rettgeri]HBC7429900.1 hypothetical protein [Providencia rettgeri]